MASVTTPTEAEIQRACLDRLNSIKGCWAWRSNTGAVISEYKGRKRMIRFGVRGQADITGMIHGVRLEIEVKRPGKRPNLEQGAFLDAIRRAGGVAAWVDSLDALERELRDEFERRGW